MHADRLAQQLCERWTGCPVKTRTIFLFFQHLWKRLASECSPMKVQADVFNDRNCISGRKGFFSSKVYILENEYLVRLFAWTSSRAKRFTSYHLLFLQQEIWNDICFLRKNGRFVRFWDISLQVKGARHFFQAPKQLPKISVIMTNEPAW